MLDTSPELGSVERKLGKENKMAYTVQIPFLYGYVWNPENAKVRKKILRKVNSFIFFPSVFHG